MKYFPVDIVYTWVDGSDEQWIAKKNNLLNQYDDFHRSSDVSGRKRFRNNDELIYYFVSNFASGSKKWIGDLIRTNGELVYREWKKYNESFTYNFRSDCNIINSNLDRNNISFNAMFNVSNGQHPKLLRLYLSKRLGTETMVALDKILSFVKNWDKEIKETIVWPDISKKLKKYKPFVRFNVTKCKFIMKEVFTNQNA